MYFLQREVTVTEKVRIKLKGQQQDIHGEVTKISMSAEGEYAMRSGKHYIKYLDSSIDENNPVSTVLKFTTEELTVIRQGTVGGTQRFAAGLIHRSPYHTPYGELDMSLETSKLKIFFADGRGRIECRYKVSINDELVGKNKLEIVISGD